MGYPSFEEGFRDIYPRVVRTLLVASLDHRLANDIAKESCVDLYVNWKKLNPKDPLTWTRNKAIKLLIKNNNNLNRFDSEISITTFELIEKALPTPYAVDLARSLIKLSDIERIIAALSYVDNCSVDEIADTVYLGKSEISDVLNKINVYLQADVHEVEKL